MTAYRIGFRFMWEQTLAVARAASIPTDSILDATARVFFAQDTFTQAMSTAYRQQADRADPRAGGRAIGVGRSAAVPADHRQSQPLGGGRPAAAAHFGTLRRGRRGAAGDRKAGIARRSRTSCRSATSGRRGGCCRTCRSASSICGARRRRKPCAQLVEVLRQAATARVGISPPFQRAGRNQRRAEIRPAGGHRKTVGRFARCRLRRHAARRRGGQRPGGDGQDQVVGAGGRERAARRGTHGAARYLPGLAAGGRLRQRRPRRRSIAIPTPCGTGCAASRS